jgi:hypothetical protein
LAAAERLRRRLVEPLPPMPADHLLDTPGRPWPDRGTLRDLVEAWARGDLDSEALSEWAQTEVGTWLLPDLPVSDPISVEVEVLLQLSTLHLGVLRPDHDGPALLAFLATPDEETPLGWQAWFRHVQGTSSPRLRGPG